MSWDAHLMDDRDHLEGDWNYTHNTNRMIAVAWAEAGGDEVQQAGGPLGPLIGPAWWKELHGMTGAQGGRYLGTIITQLRADPAKYKAMNPENGWGDYGTLLAVLEEMHRACQVEYPTKWSVHG
jgi:hypothetical protein